jgi:hypothetical protein
MEYLKILIIFLDIYKLIIIYFDIYISESWGSRFGPESPNLGGQDSGPFLQQEESGRISEYWGGGGGIGYILVC